MKKALGLSLAVLSGAMLLAAIVLGFVAIWTVGPDCERLANTALLAFSVAVASGFGAAIVIEPEGWNEW